MAPPAISTSVTELPESRVRVEAAVPPEEVEKSIAQAARALGRSMRVPGFRAGKAPAPVVIQRVGREAVLDEAVRDSIGSWYSAAIDAAAIVPLGEQVEAEVERLRERAGRLETVERPAAEGDFVVMDYKGTLAGEPFDGGEGRDQMIELGSGRLVPGFEEQLTGASAGDERTIRVTFPDASESGDEGKARGSGSPALAGQEVEFAVAVKEVKAKELPPVDDELAAEAGFDTLEELRDDIRERLSEGEERRIEAEFREAVLDSAVANAKVGVPDPLVEARSRELWDQMLHSLSHQGISKDMYLQISGRSEEEIVAESKADAERQLRREAVLAAVAAAESIEPSEEEVLEALEQAAPAESTSARKLLERMKSAGRLDAFKAELAQRKALDLLADSARPITVQQAQARDKLWTPGADAEERASQLWTPGS